VTAGTLWNVDVDALIERASSKPLPERRAPEPDDGLVWIYFVQAGEDGPVKIGSAVHLDRRLSTLQTASAIALSIIGAFRAPGAMEGTMQDLAATLSERLRGEWFSGSASLVALAEHMDRSPTGRRPA